MITRFFAILLLSISMVAGFNSISNAGKNSTFFIGPETDTGSYILVSVFDLRDRDSYV